LLDLGYQQGVPQYSRADSLTDIDSVRTEDMENEFNRSIVLLPGSSNEKYNLAIFKKIIIKQTKFNICDFIISNKQSLLCFLVVSTISNQEIT